MQIKRTHNKLENPQNKQPTDPSLFYFRFKINNLPMKKKILFSFLSTTV